MSSKKIITIFFKTLFFFVFFIINLIKKKSDLKSENFDNKNIKSEEAKDIALKITNKKELKKLESRLNKVESKLGNPSNEKYYEKAIAEHEILEEAFLIASSKIYSWQFVPSLTLDTDKAILEIAYKEFSVEDYKRIKKEIG